MKSFLRYAPLILTIMPHHSSAMDFDKESRIPLEKLSAIYNQTEIRTANPKSADQQFKDFEKKIDREYKLALYHTLTRPYLDNYFTRAQQEAPAIVASDEIVKKFSLIETSFYASTIKYLIAQTQLHYENVTCDTLSTINNPHASQSSLFLKTLPLCVRTHILRYAYEAIDKSYKIFNVPKTYAISVRNKTHTAAVVNNADSTFEIWDLKTGESRILPKKHVSGEICLSTTGSQLATTTLAQKEPTIIDLDIWDCQTGKNTHTMHHSERITTFKLINENDHTSKLIIFDTTGNILIYTIRINTDPILSENLNAHMIITKFCHQTESLYGEYSLDNNELYKNCPAYYLCLQAIKNTFAKDSLPKIKTAMLYLCLTPLEKDSIEQKIQERIKTLMKQEQPEKNLLSWFG